MKYFIEGFISGLTLGASIVVVIMWFVIAHLAINLLGE